MKLCSVYYILLFALSDIYINGNHTIKVAIAICLSLEFLVL